MARGYGYGVVSKEALIAFRDELNRGAWEQTSIKKDPKRKLPDDLSALDVFSLIKLLVVYSIDELIDVLGPEQTAQSIDGEWDDLQKDLEFELELKLRRGTPQEKAASTLLKPILLPVGLSQTQYDIPREVTFGKAQLAIARSEKATPHVALLGLQPILDKIEAKTTELEATSTNEAPSARIRRLSALCAATITDTRSTLEQLLARTIPGPAHDSLSQRLAPFLALLESAPKPKESKESNLPPEETKTVD